MQPSSDEAKIYIFIYIQYKCNPKNNIKIWYFLFVIKIFIKASFCD